MTNSNTPTNNNNVSTAKHEGCFFCGNTDQQILTSKPIWNIISSRGKQLSPHSIAICDSAHCQSQDKIDYRERSGVTF